MLIYSFLLDCGLVEIEEDLLPVNFGIAFSPDFSDEEIDRINGIFIEYRENRE
jgi:hypothetical protein